MNWIWCVGLKQAERVKVVINVKLLLPHSNVVKTVYSLLKEKNMPKDKESSSLLSTHSIQYKKN